MKGIATERAAPPLRRIGLRGKALATGQPWWVIMFNARHRTSSDVASGQYETASPSRFEVGGVAPGLLAAVSLGGGRAGLPLARMRLA